jgi:acetyltransferase-like isoleucine patch superfamily enzyme
MADVKFVRILEGWWAFAWGRFRMYTVQWVIRKLLRIQYTLSLTPSLKNTLKWALKLSSLSSFITNSNPATWCYTPSWSHCKSSTSVRTHTCAHTWTHIHAHTNTHIHIRARKHTQTYTYINTHTHTYKHKRTHTQTYTHKHTYAHTCART